MMLFVPVAQRPFNQQRKKSLLSGSKTIGCCGPPTTFTKLYHRPTWKTARSTRGQNVGIGHSQDKHKSTKEKVTRIIMAIFRNLLEKPEDREIIRENAIQMVQCQVYKTLELIMSKAYDDPEFNEDTQFVTEQLQSSYFFSSFDEYLTELKSGRLQWSPVHKTEKFWKENVQRFNEKNFELIKILVKILEVTNDPLVLCVAAHDLGQYVRHYPRGKTVIEQLNGKQMVMRLLTHEDPNVRYHALLAIQKIMVHNW
ncbi:unnamed protein product [Soboliphyme baturini]|uniref:V-ATPase_H_C domain-containing protein n=1 Tax=Soboliphyme baturini TaxID=241478 RepID=A0A183J6D6_9BILA|nr:unnamed protein product [Soboliphyme baturini]